MIKFILLSLSVIPTQLFLGPFALTFLLLACVLIVNDWIHNKFSINRSVEFFKLSIMTYILSEELLFVVAAVWTVLDDIKYLELVLLMLGSFTVLGWYFYRFERSWKYYQAKMSANSHHPSF